MTAIVVRQRVGAGATAVSPVSEVTIIAALKAELANFKIPKRIYFADDLPRNTMGKVQKNVLRQTYSGK